MSSMNAIDTNVLLYFVDKDEATKQSKADALLTALASAGTPAVLLWQVAAEFGAGLRRWEQKGKLTPWEREKHWQTAESTFPTVVFPRTNLVSAAFDLSQRHSLSYWDALLLAACVEAGVDNLYSEDLSNGLVYDSVRVVNPFV